VTPGGGFQGGAVLASASMLVVLTGSYTAFRRVNPIPMIDLAEGVGIASYPVIGTLGLLAGSAFLANVVPLGTPGDLFSGGTLPLLNIGVGLAVSAGFVLIASEFLEQTLAIRRRNG
jgi:multicomponent Na+:H+ antiporter subunit B